MHKTLLSTSRTQQLGLTFIRIGIGAVFIIHGWGKIIDPGSWQWLGSQMSHVGVTVMPSVWGFIAAATEFFGGLCLVLGLGVRFITGLMAFTMLIALFYHINNGDPFKTYAHPLSLLLIFVGIMLAGADSFSLDHWLHRKKKKYIKPDTSHE